ncbi:MAG: FAD-dependent oxidoreductase [Granulosicoccus sp.]
MTSNDPIVIVGSGPVGMRAAHEVLSRLPDRSVVIYGDEMHEPYNRVRLSTWLAGDVKLVELAQPLKRPFGSKVDLRFGYEVCKIDRASHTITDSAGKIQTFSKLILATGSTPHIPDIPGVELDGVYTLRDMDDALALMARRARSHHTVVLGGGLLGLEAARGMQPGNTRVTVIEHSDRLLSRQLDPEASELLQKKMDELGLHVRVNDGVAEIQGQQQRVTGVKLHSGDIIACDSIIVATGIRPRISLAQQAKLAYGRGITVNDDMRTSDPSIYAVGECVEHRGNIYGLVAPGFEQASVAAADIAGLQGSYTGSVAASRLKVLGTTVFSLGPMGDNARSTDGKRYTYRDSRSGLYRKILVRRHRLQGALGIGEWSETVRLQPAIAAKAHVFPWQVLRFAITGKLWSDAEGKSTSTWADSTVVCQCNGVSKGRICEAISRGAVSLEQVASTTGASTVCGSCKPLVVDLLGNGQKLDPTGWHKGLVVTATLSLVVTLAFLFAPVISYATSVQLKLLTAADSSFHWDELWRNRLVKQVTGFSILGIFAVGLLISLRKRLPRIVRFGRYDAWRFAHVLLGTLALFMLVAHTGFRMGHGLNYWLMTCFIGLLVVGTISSIVVGTEHRLTAPLASQLKRYSIWAHIFLFWPVPVLLGWHVLKGYWY